MIRLANANVGTFWSFLLVAPNLVIFPCASTFASEDTTPSQLELTQLLRTPNPISASIGRAHRGRVRAPIRLPPAGKGYVIPDKWSARGNHYGVPELVQLIINTSRVLHQIDPRSTLAVADLSSKRGGRTRWHKSHQSGRDVDLIFFSMNEQGEPLPPPLYEMIRYNRHGVAYRPRNRSGIEDELWSKRRFDVRRNWQLIALLLQDSSTRIQWIFVNNRLKRLMLNYARDEGYPEWLIAYAEVVFHQPAASSPHNDHFHVRIYCPSEDRKLGCIDTGPIWSHEKKTYKYVKVDRQPPRPSQPSQAFPRVMSLE